jgi:hypothetical protein
MPDGRESRIQKADPPRGGDREGRVRHGVDEAPVPDAGSTIGAFSSEVDTGSREENAPNRNRFSRSLVVAGAHATHEVAVGIELANPAAAAITAIVVAIGRGDRAADHGGANETCAYAPSQGRSPWLLPGWWWKRCCR